MITIHQTSLLLMLMIAISIDGIAMAETSRRTGDGGSAALAKVQNTLRQVSAERDAMATENARLGDQIKKLEADLEKISKAKKRVEKKLERSVDRIGKFKDNNSLLRERLVDAQDKMQKVVKKYRELVATLGELERDGNMLKSELASRDNELNLCSANNQKLYDTTIEVISRYENMGFWDALAKAEPITQLKRVEIERISEQYRQSAGENRHISSLDAD